MIGTGKTDTHPILTNADTVVDTVNLLWRGTAFKGIFITDKIFLVEDNGEKHVKEWLKSVIKESVEEVLRGEE